MRKTGHSHAGLRRRAGTDAMRRSTRRAFLIALGAGVLTAPLFSLAQQQRKVWHIGFLSPQHPPYSPASDSFDEPFLRGMSELGYVEGKNLAMERRFADGDSARFAGLAAELVRLKVDVIVTVGTEATSAAQKATATIPVVFGSAGDPVGNGFAHSLARPGGNLTGLTNIASDLGPKLLEMVLGMAPKLSRVAVLLDPDNVSHVTILGNIQDAAHTRNVKILPVKARGPRDIAKAFAMMAREGAGAVIVAADALFTQQRRQIAELARKHRLPSISAFREFAEEGVLMSYGPNLADTHWRAATYVDKILKGARPGDLPVEQPTKFELIINGKTAKALGLKIPQSLLISVDKVIE
jgi:putative ABC transport system substrate-binding protein